MIPFGSLTPVCLLIFLLGLLLPGAQPLGHASAHGSVERNNNNKDKVVKIGLLIPDPEALAAEHGAALAIRKANEAGGNWSFQLVVRSTEGLWGAGSKESVSLVFEDEVVVMMGSLDGRNAHLAEQVATKTRIVFLSTWATDMTLSKAFVPWYFRCIPNDDQQAAALVREIYHKRKCRQVAAIATEAYDARYAANAFVKLTGSMNLPAPRQFICGESGKDLSGILSAIGTHDTEAIVLFGSPGFASEIIPALKQRSMDPMIFGTLAITDGQKPASPDWDLLEGMVLVSSGHWFTAEGMAFQSAFHKNYGYQPGPVAAYAYDGINVIIGVIRRAGADRDRIIEAFAGTDHKTGITGEIRFDAKGNRAGTARVMMVKNGKPYLIHD
jgi:branched-chain amino acid transport system substrate-binding protein